MTKYELFFVTFKYKLTLKMYCVHFASNDNYMLLRMMDLRLMKHARQ